MTDTLRAELIERIRAKNVLLIIGTGVSLAVTDGNKLSSWTGLLSDGVETCYNRAVSEGVLNEDWVERQKRALESDVIDLLSVAQQVSHRLGWKPTEPCDGEWNAWLRRTVGSLTVHKPDIISSIYSLNCPIATLNYDSLLENQAKKRPITWMQPERWIPVIQRQDDAILHLHGHWETPSSVILGVASYANMLNGKLSQSLQKTFAATMSIVFIGCSGTFQDPNLSALVEWMSTHISGAEHSHYLLLSDGAKAPIPIETLRKARISILRYGPSHDCLGEYIASLGGNSLFVKAPKTQSRDVLREYKDEGVVPDGIIDRDLVSIVSDLIFDRESQIEIIRVVNEILLSSSDSTTPISKGSIVFNATPYRFWESLFDEAGLQGRRATASILLAITEALNRTGRYINMDRYFDKLKEKTGR